MGKEWNGDDGADGEIAAREVDEVTTGGGYCHDVGDTDSADPDITEVAKGTCRKK